MGRSRGIFLQGPGTRDTILKNAAAFGQSHGYKVEMATISYVRLGRGNAAVSKKTNVLVSAVDMPQGVQVTVDAWLEDMSESNIDPRGFGGKKKKAWGFVEALCKNLGSPEPSTFFQHI